MLLFERHVAKSHWCSRTCLIFVSVLVSSLIVLEPLMAIENLKSLIPFGKRVEADPRGNYELTDADGPWMILACTFSGPNAEEEAHELVMELRKRFNLEAYTHNRTFDYTAPVEGLGFNEFGQRRLMRHQHNNRVKEIAVLVGDFSSADDHDMQKVLTKIKHAKPETLKFSKDRKSTSQRFAVLRETQRLLSPDPEKKEMGPMRTAFVTRNPLLPEEFFLSREPDELILEMNKNVKYSLLDCPGRYTVRVASFRGKSTMKLDEMPETNTGFAAWIRGDNELSRLEQAAEDAHKLTVALRERGVDAYEFHDRSESIVTVGQFESYGRELPNGSIELLPAVHAIMETYKAQPVALPNQTSQAGLKQKTLGGIPFDITPVPIEVPHYE